MHRLEYLPQANSLTLMEVEEETDEDREPTLRELTELMNQYRRNTELFVWQVIIVCGVQWFLVWLVIFLMMKVW